MNDDTQRQRYRISVVCEGVPVEAKPELVAELLAEFANRDWHHNVQCQSTGKTLLLIAENDFDPQGLALIDEFSDAISACIAEPFDGNIRVVSSEKL